MFRRITALLVLCAGLTACKQDPIPVSNTLFHGQGDVRVLDAQIVPTGDSSGGTGATTLGWVIARVEFTNDLGVDTVPQISNFYLLDRSGTHYQAHDSGSSVFTGISNSQEVLPKNQKRIYTIGFRASDPNISGDIFYDR